MEERYIASVDLGSAKIALTVAKVSGNDIQILYYKEVPSKGIRNNAVFNPQLASGPIREIIEDAEKELNIRILQVVVGLPRCEVRLETNSADAVRSMPDECISEEEVESLKELALLNYPGIDPAREELYGAVAQSFNTDDEFQIVEGDVVGMVSEKLTGNFKLFIGKKSSVKTIDSVFNKLHIAIAKKCFTPDAVAKAVLTEDEKESGVALIDMGAGATSVSIYKGKILRYYASIPFGGRTVTGDIKNECMIGEELAENIKKAYGACMPDKLVTLAEKIIQIEGEEGMTGPKQIPVKYLSELISARVQEIIDAMLWSIQESGLADSLRSGIVITGGGAAMGNIAPFIKDISGYEVRIGIPRHLFTATGCSKVKEVSATTALGMILSAKSDLSLNCIDPVDSYDTEDDIEIVAGGGTEDNYAEMETDNGPVIDDNAQEGETVDLFGADEVPVVEQKPENKPKKKKEKPQSPKWFTLTWGKITRQVENLYENAGQDEQ